MKIKYCSARCGAGKTRQIVNRAIELAKEGELVLILQPTKELINKTIEDELERRPDRPYHKVFHGGTIGAGRFVAQELTEFLVSPPPDRGVIVFATHQAFPLIPYWPTKGDWHLMIDECPQAFRCDTHRIPKTHSIITDDLSIEPYDSIYGAVVPRSKNAFEQKVRNTADDEILAALQETMRIIINPNWRTFVNWEQYEKLKAGSCPDLTFHSTLDPKLARGFKSVLIVGADIEESGLFQLWSIDGVTFVPDDDLAAGLRYITHGNTHRTVIQYFIEKPWSKRIQNRELDDGIYLDRMVSIIKEKFADVPFLWQANKRTSDDIFDPPAIRLPNSPHGLNAYSHIDNVAFLSALNPIPAHIKFLKHMGLTAEAIRRATYMLVAYQAVMRSSLRDPSNHNERIVIVPDKKLAHYLSERLPDAQISKIDIEDPSASAKPAGRPRVHASNAAKSAAHRRRQQEQSRQKMLADLRMFARQHQLGSGCIPCDSAKSRNEISIDLIGDFVTRPCQGTVYKTKTSSHPVGYLACSDNASFIEVLRYFHFRKLHSKSENSLISPAIFNPNIKPGNDQRRVTTRGKINIVYLQHIWLDFEDGELTPEQFAELFPGIEMILMNSFNHTKGKPRFRVVMLTTQAISAEVHEVLFDLIERKLEDAGYVAKPKSGSSYKKSGLDRSKRSAASLFYLPCQAKSPSDSFIHHKVQGRSPLDPVTWISNAQLSFVQEAEHEAAQHAGVDQAKVDVAINQWRESPRYKGEGNNRFFRLAEDLKKAGMDSKAIRSTLAAEAVFGRSPQERKDQIVSIMQSLFRNVA